MFVGKPIIGIVGGIGSGKSFVADLFGELGCLVIHSDQQIHEVYRTAQVKEALRQWWGGEIFLPDGEVNKAAVAGKVFNDPGERGRLEQLLHPLIGQARDEMMRGAAKNQQVLAFVWDAPLLFEVSLNRQCDAVVFVEAPLDVRLSRVRERGWNRQELLRREISQLPLDKKRRMSDHVVDNTADADDARRQVKEIFSRILAIAAKAKAD